MKTKIFFDTEFTGLHQKTTLISIGLISDCGKTFYAELTDYDLTQCDDWIKNNVLKNLTLKENDNDIETNISYKDINHVTFKGKTKHLELVLRKWFEQFKEIEIWSDCLAYDWVLFNEIFGHAFDIPKNVYYIPFDICTLFKFKGIDPDISREKFAQNDMPEQKHNALFDAKIIKMCYEKLIIL